MLIKIIIPVSIEDREADIKRVASRYNIMAKKINELQYSLETEDALNFFLMGMKFNNGQIWYEEETESE